MCVGLYDWLYVWGINGSLRWKSAETMRRIFEGWLKVKLVLVPQKRELDAAEWLGYNHLNDVLLFFQTWAAPIFQDRQREHFIPDTEGDPERFSEWKVMRDENNNIKEYPEAISRIERRWEGKEEKKDDVTYRVIVTWVVYIFAVVSRTGTIPSSQSSEGLVFRNQHANRSTRVRLSV